MSRRRKIAIGAVGAVALIAIVSIGIAATRSDAVLVRTETIGRRDLVSMVTASGYVQPKRKVEISADISGRVIQLAVAEGQWVETGDLLLRIDPTAYQAAGRRAEAAEAQAQAQASQSRANLLQAQNAARRAEQLASGELSLISTQELEQAQTQAAVSEAQYEAARFGVAQAQAALSEAREAVRKTTIAAPMSGRVTRLNIEEGETAVIGTMNNPGSLLLTISDLSEMEARVKVDETDVPDIAVGDSAVVRIDAFADLTFSGRVTRIANSSLQNPEAAQSAAGGQAPQSVDFEVMITLDEPPETLRPDLSATADIITAQRTSVVAVPIISMTVRDSAGNKLDAATDDEEEDAPVAGPRTPRTEFEGVFVVSGDTATFVPVKVGITGEQYFEVLSGLEGGETVVSGTYQTIRELVAGDAVRTAKEDTGAAK